MEVKSLQIGDYVDYRGKIIKVTSLYDKGGSNEVGWSDKESVWVNADNVEPIPITPEVLEKNGFVGILSDCGIDYSSEVYKLRIIRRRNDEGWTIYANHFGLDKKDLFVHELQHALRLCGIEKEIIL